MPMSINLLCTYMCSECYPRLSAVLLFTYKLQQGKSTEHSNLRHENERITDQNIFFGLMINMSYLTEVIKGTWEKAEQVAKPTSSNVDRSISADFQNKLVINF